MFYFHRISEEPPSTAQIHTDFPQSEEILHQEKHVNGCISFRNIQRKRLCDESCNGFSHNVMMKPLP